MTLAANRATELAPGPATERVLAHVRGLIETGRLRPGDRLAPERELAEQIGVSRPTVRAGLRTLTAMGVMIARQGSGTFMASGPTLGAEWLTLQAALYGYSRAKMFEARRVLELGAVALAAERAGSDDLAVLAEEVAGMYAALDDPTTYFEHDVRFHVALAVASGNPFLRALIEMLAATLREHRGRTVHKARDLKESAEMHRRVYQAIRARDPRAARSAMDDHLLRAERAQAQEDSPGDATPDTTP